jgi:hypothetical protein
MQLRITGGHLRIGLSYYLNLNRNEKIDLIYIMYSY